MTSEEIRTGFRENLQRVRRLVENYEVLKDYPSQGRASVERSDILRAAVVLLYAALEDLLRMIDRETLRASRFEILSRTRVPREVLDSIRLSDLEAYRHRTCDELIQMKTGKSVKTLASDALDARILESENKNYTHPGHIEHMLEQRGFPASLLHPHRNDLGAMASRRHRIVHKADANHELGKGHHKTRSLGRSVVESWYNSVQQLGDALISAHEARQNHAGDA